MVYRLSTGASSDLKRRLTSAGMVLGITIGFPLLAAWLNYENLIPGPTNITQDDTPGVVLGQNTDSNAAAGDDDSTAIQASTTPATTPVSTAEPLARPSQIKQPGVTAAPTAPNNTVPPSHDSTGPLPVVTTPEAPPAGPENPQPPELPPLLDDPRIIPIETTDPVDLGAQQLQVQLSTPVGQTELSVGL